MNKSPWVGCFNIVRKAFGFEVDTTMGLVGLGMVRKNANLGSLFGLTLGLDKQLFTLEK